MQKRIEDIEAMLFDGGTTNRIDFRNVKIRETAIVNKEKPNYVRLKARTSPLKNVHTLTDWKGGAVPFSLAHFRKDIIRTCPNITLEEPVQDNRSNKEEEQVRWTRPRVVMTPAVSIDDVADQHVRQILLDDVYTSTTRRTYKESKTSCHNVKAPLPLRLAPTNPGDDLVGVAAKVLVPETYVEIVRDMYRNSDSIVRTAVGDTTPFPITVGVHQGSVLSPYFFCVILDELSASVQKLSQPWLLMYADDIALVDGDKGRLTRRVHAWREALENGGLKLNVAKTEYLACNSTDLTSLRIGDDTVEHTDNFKYLGSVLDASGDIDRDIKACISTAWAKWRKLALAKWAPPLVSLQWRWESAKWDRKQLRAHCEPTKEFWLRRN
ncbi:unnamed protein product [Parnassius mnemosyne]|uniref:Reverse transcriptase domain-containing protein n=1 Tax=Parnassius mnemosyne TaxID=213953 RepID=A0AAV1MA87_9NEOP